MHFKHILISILFILFITQSLFSQFQQSPFQRQPQGQQNQQNQNQNQRPQWSSSFPESIEAENQAQLQRQNPQDMILVPNPQLAVSTPDYQVTAGDIYMLTFMAGTNPVEFVIVVDSSYRIRVANLGIVDARGRSFTQLRTQVETIVTNNFPLGAPQLILRQPATFKVYLRGEVNNSVELTAWGLVRLSRILEEHLTSFSSLRDITIRSSAGQTRTYDLFRANRMGDITQNPYLRPDDVITINRADRQVLIEGAVERPGIYQLLEGENFRELIEIYASGFIPTSDRTRVEVVRYTNSLSMSGDKIFLNEQSLEENFVLENFDVLFVPEVTALKPVVFIEGAVTAEGELVASIPQASNRLVIPFNRGETYGSLVRANSTWFSAVSDTSNAYIIRGDSTIPLNLNPMLFDESYLGDSPIVENDVLVIPFRQYFVTVAGAVHLPGRYPYIPDRSWDYYIALAGGVVPGRNFRNSLRIFDINGVRLDKNSVITPESIITANTNHWLFYFNQVAPVITTMLSIVATTISIYFAVNR